MDWKKRSLSLDVKDEGFNINTMITTSKSIVNCETFDVEVSFQGTSFRHVFFNVYKHAIVEIIFWQKIELCFHHVCLSRFAKMYNMAKNSRKG